MSNTIIRDGYNNEIVLQLTKPKIVNVSAVPYMAEVLGMKIMDSGVVNPFIIASAVEVTLKVETWDGTVITWTFTPGPYPMPLRKIFTDVANTATTIQIAY